MRLLLAIILACVAFSFAPITTTTAKAGIVVDLGPLRIVGGRDHYYRGDRYYNDYGYRRGYYRDDYYYGRPHYRRDYYYRGGYGRHYHNHDHYRYR